MAKHSGQKFQITIENGTRPYTSLRRAQKVCQRGLAEWTGPCSIRFRKPEEVVIERQLAAKLKADDQYWREVSQTRGGSGEVSAMWFAGKVRATENQDDWMPRQLGYTVMEARIIPTIEKENQ